MFYLFIIFNISNNTQSTLYIYILYIYSTLYIYTCIYTHTHTHTYIYIYIYTKNKYKLKQLTFFAMYTYIILLKQLILYIIWKIVYNVQ